MMRGFILIPGAGISDWIWTRLIPLLRWDSVPIPKRIEPNTCENRLACGFEDIMDYACSVVESSGFEEVILAGHSGGGFIASELGKRVPKVKHIVFLAANIPVHGGTALDSFSEEARAKHIEGVQLQAAVDTFPVKSLELLFRAYFCNRTTEEDMAYILNQQFQPEPVCALTHKADWRDYPEIGMTYILCREDRTLTVSQQLSFAANAGITDIRMIESDHMVMLSHAGPLAEELNDIAGKLWGAPAEL